MAVVDVLNLNIGTEQNPNFVLHDIHDKRITTTAVTTATHLLSCDAGINSIAPITAANLASVLGANKWKQILAVAETLDVYVRDQAAFLIQSNSGTCIVGLQPDNPYQRVIGNNDTGLTFAKGTNWQHLVITNASSGELEVTIYRII